MIKKRPASVSIGRRISLYYPKFLKSEFKQTFLEREKKKKDKTNFKISEKEIDFALSYLEKKKKKKNEEKPNSTIDAAQLHKKLEKFFPKISINECQFLIGKDVKFLEKKSILELFAIDTIQKYDPVEEVFSKVFDIEKKGVITKNSLRTLFTNLGINNIDEDDLNVLVKASGGKDEIITLENFRNMI